ncbi:pimeloyl-ACP methyl ester carboxylesterase [Silvibacterium bohemicum]|uniref:Pimeloyl-ACP methyl ester carboxylesterase n=1 Tax=Silvibacterium bohemicum TaxID=1577686 RepID=A0A841JND8_9BACT|nr:alpha/beta hydrolase [Silvibacterium bohemicum]MBB6142660.1 pimeloyl-ACP methyl ester carboxylesterase [Silvibacterium bohemicum]
MKAIKSFGNVAVACAALLTIILSAAKATAQTSSASGAKTVLLVHGAWADGSCWSKVIPLLEAKGLHVVAVQIPLTSFADDIAATQRAIALEDGPVLLVGHSYGGAVITEAGNDPKVAGLVYISAVAPDQGESAFGLITSVQTPIGSELRPDKSGFLKLTPKGIAEDFAQDLSAKEIAILTATQVPTSVGAMKGEVTNPAWKSKASWYIVAANDRAISPELEKTQAKKIGATTTTVASSHVIMLAQPAQVANVILDAASKAASK